MTYRAQKKGFFSSVQLLSQNMGLSCIVRKKTWGFVVFIPKVHLQQEWRVWNPQTTQESKQESSAETNHSLRLAWKNFAVNDRSSDIPKGRNQVFYNLIYSRWKFRKRKRRAANWENFFIRVGTDVKWSNLVCLFLFFSVGKKKNNNLECVVWRQLLSNFIYITECLISNSEEPKCIYLLQI